MGILFGIPAGVLEEIGWVGFVFPKLTTRRKPLSAAVFLGLVWGLWHLPVINFLGTVTPHGRYRFPFFLAFAYALTAMRAIICWSYTHSQSVLLAQLLHISSIGSLVIFSPPSVSGCQEAFRCFLYGAAPWLPVVPPIIKSQGKNLDENACMAGL